MRCSTSATTTSSAQRGQIDRQTADIKTSVEASTLQPHGSRPHWANVKATEDGQSPHFNLSLTELARFARPIQEGILVAARYGGVEITAL